MRDEQQIAALRKEIRRAGMRLDRIGITSAVGGAFVFLVLWTGGVIAILLLGREVKESVAFNVAGAVACSALLGGFAVARCMPIIRARRAQQFRRELATLSAEERARLVGPLMNDAVESVRKIAAAVAGSPNARAELTPANAPAGRGDEAAAGEPPHGSRLDY